MLKDDGSAEDAMKDMEQMMSFLKTSIDQAKQETAAEAKAAGASQQSQPTATSSGQGKTFLQRMMENTGAT